MKQLLFILAFITTNFIETTAQEAKIYFDKVITVLEAENLSSSVSVQLDSLVSNHIPSRSNFNKYFDRDLGLGYRHQRIKLKLNFERFQIDLLKKNDTMLVRLIKSEDYRKIEYSYVDKSRLSLFLKERNNYYQSSKTVNELLEEISWDGMFAFYCGDGLPKTEEGIEIEKLVEDEDIDKLIELLKSLCVEKQAYGVAGFEMLVKQGYDLPTDVTKLIHHIRNRNSATVTCSGCLSGLIETLYN